MGLFRNRNSSAWAVKSVAGVTNKGAPTHDNKSQQKADDLTSSLISLTLSEGLGGNEQDQAEVNSNASNSNASSQQNEVLQLLQQQLHQKDLAISQLRQSMETSERAQLERVALLERQLEQLVELSECDRAIEGKSSITFLKSRRAPQHNDDTNNARDESAALQELLVRVLAEKDNLKFQNENLRKIISKQKPQELRCQH